MNKTKILIADDHTIVRIGLTAILNAEKDMEVVGEAKNGVEAVRKAKQLLPDVIIMDLFMPKKNGSSEVYEKIHWGFWPIYRSGTHCNLIG